MGEMIMSINAVKSLFLAVDIQNDFFPAYTSASGIHFSGGALAVPRADEVVVPVNKLAAAFAASGGWVAATQDWHPEGHASFASSHPGKKTGDTVDLEDSPGQILWPDHCVQGKPGSAFHDDFDLRPVNLIVRKGYRRGLDSYSAFFENDRKTPTGLDGWIRGLGIETIVIGGLATDYCVYYSAMDAIKLGYKTIVADDTVRGVDYPPGLTPKAIARMMAAGIIFTATWEILED